MNKCLNRFFSLYYIYIFEFLLFFTWIYMIPPVGDRYMERGGINAIEGLFRFSFCQIRWISIANGRALSNIFSYLVDGNIIIRAITNSAMITFGSIICYKIALVEDAKYQNLIMARFFSVLGFIFVGWEIKAEVYFYATTLFVSTYVICLFIIYLIKINETKGLKNSTLLLLLTFLGSVWIENSSIMLVSIFGLLCLYKFILKKNDKHYIYAFLLSLSGLCFLFLSSRFAAMGRLNQTGAANRISLKTIIGLLEQVFVEESLLFLILSIIMLFVIWTNNLKLRYGKICFGVWVINSIFCVCLSMQKAYKVISTDPVDAEYVANVYGWANFKNEKIESFFLLFNNKYDVFFPILCLLIAASGLYIFIHLQNRLVLIITASGMVSALCLSITGLGSGGRVRSLSIFILIALETMLIICIDYKFTMVKRLTSAGGIVLLIMGIFIIDEDTAFIKKNYYIEKSRKEIVEIVKQKQILEEWDYDQYAVFPKYTDSGSGRRLAQAHRNNATNNDPYYPYILKYYGLNEKTKLIFSDTDTYVLATWDKDSPNVSTQKVVFPQKYKNVLYSVAIYQGGVVLQYIPNLTEPVWDIFMEVEQYDQCIFIVYILNEDGSIMDTLEVHDKCYWFT